MQRLNAINFLYVFYHSHLISLIAGISPSNIRELLISHNFYRRMFVMSDPHNPISNMNKLVWDPYLALQAMNEVSCDSWNTTIPGTNTARIRHHPFMLTYVVRRWFSQNVNYLDSEKECFPWNSCPHLRNFLNARHRSVGCAVASRCGQSQDKVVIMCKYRGGHNEEFGFQFGPACTGCSGSSSFCNNELCDECDASRQECDCRKTCSKEGVGMGTLNPSTCSCDCSYGHGQNCDQPCVNKQQFVDFDVCSILPPSECNDPINGVYYREFCPAVCSCRPYPQQNGE